jgi:hypothetical protein
MEGQKAAIRAQKFMADYDSNDRSSPKTILFSAR